MPNKSACMLFWDYDTQWGADRSRSPGGPKDWGYMEFENTERLLDLHAQYEIPACFAVVGAAALPGQRPYHDPDQIRRIHIAGHEIASHTHHHEWIPGLGRRRLVETLRSSKDVLEQCIGVPVVSFVPPFNQPFDYPKKGSFSLSERRDGGKDRIDLVQLCEVLQETGYHFCRVSYRSLYRRVVDRLLGHRSDGPVAPEWIAGVRCIRLNTSCGFDRNFIEKLNAKLCQGGIWVLYGHPHSVHNSTSAQSINNLESMFKMIHSWRSKHLIEMLLPRNLIK
jgi:hypothetical protein